MIRAVHTLVRELQSRPLSRVNHAGAWLALLTCPCHVGVVAALLAGTAVGGWLAARQAWLTAVMAVLFITGVGLLFLRPADSCDRCEQ
jgi:hypothetical protein